FYFERLFYAVTLPTENNYFFDTISLNCEVSALFSAADRCFPRARLQPPRENHSVGSSDTCYSRRSQRSSAPNNRHIKYSHDKNYITTQPTKAKHADTSRRQ